MADKTYNLGIPPTKAVDLGDGSHAVAVALRDAAFVYSAPAFAAVGVATTQIVAANADRVVVVIVNDSDTTVYLAVGNGAVVGSGIRINAGGGSAQFGGPGGLPLTLEAINGIHGDVGGKNVTVQEAE